MNVIKALLYVAAVASPVPTSSPVRAGQDARSAETGGEPTDPHRPPCTTAECRTIESFLKQHYCGEFPYGNGSADSCDLRVRKRVGSPKVHADTNCHWDADSLLKCRQNGHVQPTLRAISIREMRKRGLPQAQAERVLFTVWGVPASSWFLVAADYTNVSESVASICEVILLVGAASKVTVVRAVPFHRTDADVPTSTTWQMVDVVDVDGDGRPELVLEGDAYEDHWLEVVRIEDGSVKTIFSGLGYSL
jgi:hypothetical protein